MSKLYLEIEGEPLEDGAEHPLEYFKKELIEYFENWGWKVNIVNEENE